MMMLPVTYADVAAADAKNVEAEDQRYREALLAVVDSRAGGSAPAA